MKYVFKITTDELPNLAKELMTKINSYLKVLLTIDGREKLTKEEEKNLLEKIEQRLVILYQYITLVPKEEIETLITMFGIKGNNWLLKTKIIEEVIEKILNDFAKLVWYVDSINDRRISWNEWLKEPLGVMARKAIAKKKLDRGEVISASDLAFLANTSLGNIAHQIKYQAIFAEMQGQEWRIKPEEAKRYLKESAKWVDGLQQKGRLLIEEIKKEKKMKKE